ncbi:hypothetical protein GX586_00060, partial [bacterium]|nr:hypothetical protein [bacterium]
GDAGKFVHLHGLAPVLENCFTRVVIEGQHSVKVSASEGYVRGFVNTDAPATNGSGSEEFINPPVYMVRSYQDSGIDTETLRVTRSYSDWESGGTPGDTVPGEYYRDDRWQYDTAADHPTLSGYRGDAYTLHKIRRTLPLINDNVGDAVYVSNEHPDDEDDSIEDRSADGAELAEEVLAMLSTVRYTGMLELYGSPILCPHRRITVRNHPKHGTVTFVPQAIEWAMSGEEGRLSYRLGDDRYNPIEELQLVQALRWRDKLPPRAREPQVVRG